MSFFEKIGIKQKCGCGREHLCPIDYIKISEGAIDELSHIAEKYTKILVVADENTYAVAGDKVVKALSGKKAEKMIFGSELLVPNEDAINKIEKKLTSDVELVVGIGSGVINDLCKYTSFRANIPYVIVATAPSMDGYASVGCALILDGLKVTLNGRVPMAILADTEVLVTAPLDMILSGYGDIIGKYSCLSDWRLSALVNGEYLCEDVWQATMREVEKTRALSDKITLKDKAAVGSLMESLVAVGVLMAYVGNSRPASGSEHHFSHYFEITGIISGKKYLPHGIDVFYSAAETAKLREKLLSLDAVPEKSSYDKAARVKDTKRIYGELADETLALQKKVGFYDGIDKRLSVYREKWDEIRSLLSKAPSFSEMEKILSDVRMNYSDFVDFYGIDRINDGILYAKDTKDRYTVLWMYYDIFSGKLEL